MNSWIPILAVAVPLVAVTLTILIDWLGGLSRTGIDAHVAKDGEQRNSQPAIRVD